MQRINEVSVRLSELDLLLRIVDTTDVASSNRRYESARGIMLLRREPLGTYDSILALHLAQMMQAAGGQTVLISREEIHGLYSGVLSDTDRDAVTFAARIDGAIARLNGLEILCKNRDDEDSYTNSPVITAIMTASVIRTPAAVRTTPQRRGTSRGRGIRRRRVGLNRFATPRNIQFQWYADRD